MEAVGQRETNLHLLKELFGEKRLVVTAQVDPWPTHKNGLDRKNTPELLSSIGNSKVDAVIFAGSTGTDWRSYLTALQDSLELIMQKKFVGPHHYGLMPPVAYDNIFSGQIKYADSLMVYKVLNSSNPDHYLHWHMKWDQMWLKERGTPAPWNNTVSVGYVILNKNADVGAVLGPSLLDVGEEDVQTYALRAAREDGVLYLEGSGSLIPIDVIDKTAQLLHRANYKDVFLIIGGGITDSTVVKERLEVCKGRVKTWINTGDGWYANPEAMKSVVETAKQYSGSF